MSYDTDHLSPRETEVFRLAGLGLTTRQVAKRLCLSVKTIDAHYCSIRSKLGLRSVHELRVRAIREANR